MDGLRRGVTRRDISDQLCATRNIVLQRPNSIRLMWRDWRVTWQCIRGLIFRLCFSIFRRRRRCLLWLKRLARSLAVCLRAFRAEYAYAIDSQKLFQLFRSSSPQIGSSLTCFSHNLILRPVEFSPFGAARPWQGWIHTFELTLCLF